MKTPNRSRFVFVGAFVVLFPVIVWTLLWRNAPTPRDLSLIAGAFSDIVSPVFAVFAFGGLVFTAFLQGNELSLQRQELKDTREELKRTANAQEASEMALAAQAEVEQLTGRLEAARALFAYYDEIGKRLSDVSGHDDEVEAFEYCRRAVPDVDPAFFEKPEPTSAESLRARHAELVQAIGEARVQSAIEMHFVRDVLREKARVASDMMLAGRRL